MLLQFACLQGLQKAVYRLVAGIVRVIMLFWHCLIIIIIKLLASTYLHTELKIQMISELNIDTSSCRRVTILPFGALCFFFLHLKTCSFSLPTCLVPKSFPNFTTLVDHHSFCLCGRSNPSVSKVSSRKLHQFGRLFVH